MTTVAEMENLWSFRRKPLLLHPPTNPGDQIILYVSWKGEGGAVLGMRFFFSSTFSLPNLELKFIVSNQLDGKVY